MGLNYGDTFEDFKSMLDNVIDDAFILDGLSSLGLLPKKTFEIKNIKFKENNSSKIQKTNLVDKKTLKEEYYHLQTSFDNRLMENKDISFSIPLKKTEKVSFQNNKLAA
ncbi:MAG: hypothetical protein JJU16_03255 [Alkalibacterium sp.]|nr:hypothetical protein [Alkalibacterium sp.]